MKQLVASILLILLFEVLLSECANPKAPMGGPKDTIPPTLLESFPPAETTNFDKQEIRLVFDERITADKLSSNLIITPNIEIKYKTIIKKDEFVIKFEKPFPDSTTITLNFFDGIADANEQTPAVNLTYVFSTGNFLDSLQVSGEVKNLMTAKPMEKIIVGLFPFSDTLDIFTTKPMYFTSSDKEGMFGIANIKQGTYKLLAFNDQNRNLTFDASAEAYGFLADPIVLDSNILNLSIPMIRENATELLLMASRSLGNYFDIQYNKSLNTTRLSSDIHYNITEDLKSIRVYKPEEFVLADSLETFVTASDSLGNSRVDTVFVKFNENVRNAAQFVTSIEPQSKKKVDKTTRYTLTFNKPVDRFDSALVHYAKDSTISIQLDSTINFEWNNTRTQLSFISTFDTTAYFLQQKNLIQERDTIMSDTLVNRGVTESLDSSATETSKPKKKRSKSNVSSSIDLQFPEGTFISIEKDTLEAITNSYTFFKQPDLGLIFLTITTETPKYTVQLIDKSFTVIREFEGQADIKITNLLPGDYGIRILIDQNEDGNWSKGNILKNHEPEPVYLFPEFTSIRANWENTLDISF